MTKDEPNDRTGEEEHSGPVTVSLEEILETDLEAPIRDSRNVDCWSLASLYDTASERQPSSRNDVAARVYGLLA